MPFCWEKTPLCPRSCLQSWGFLFFLSADGKLLFFFPGNRQSRTAARGCGMCERLSQPSNATVFLAAFLMLMMWSWSRLSVLNFYQARSVPNTRLPWSYYLCNSFFSLSQKKKKTDLGLTETSWINKAELNNQQWVLWWKCLLYFIFYFFLQVASERITSCGFLRFNDDGRLSVDGKHSTWARLFHPYIFAGRGLSVLSDASWMTGGGTAL